MARFQGRIKELIENPEQLGRILIWQQNQNAQSHVHLAVKHQNHLVLQAVQVNHHAKLHCPKSECSQEKVCSSWKDEGLKYEGEVADEFDLIVVGSGPGGYLACWNGW